MAARTLPDFKKPPVVEVAISAFFLPVAGMKTVRFGEFWIANQKEYPKTEDYPPLIEFTEGRMQFPHLRRVFMITNDDRFVMQVQQDAFIHNWRKIKDNDEYPHFDAARNLFREKLEIFKEFVQANQLGDLSATRYEVTYVNHLLEEDGKFLTVLDKDVSLISLQPVSERKLLGEPRTMNADVMFDLPNDSGTLRVSFKQGTRAADQKEVLQVELTARGKAKPDFSDMDVWLEVAHESIVRGFTEITTKQAHEQWGRIA